MKDETILSLEGLFHSAKLSKSHCRLNERQIAWWKSEYDHESVNKVITSHNV
jgi:hypothetical protein